MRGTCALLHSSVGAAVWAAGCARGGGMAGAPARARDLAPTLCLTKGSGLCRAGRVSPRDAAGLGEQRD